MRHHLIFQTMLRAVKDENSNFAKNLAENLSIRILQRRGAASRLSMYVVEYEENTDLDKWLAETSNEVILSGKEALWNTFIEQTELSDELAKFRATQERSTDEETTASAAQQIDEYTARVVLGKKKSPPKKKSLSTQEIMKLHAEGHSLIPTELVETLQTLQPTSVPAERAFSIARHMRRHCQESLSDERFSDYLFLRDFYRNTEPWTAFKTKYTMSSECNFEFTAEEEEARSE